MVVGTMSSKFQRAHLGDKLSPQECLELGLIYTPEGAIDPRKIIDGKKRKRVMSRKVETSGSGVVDFFYAGGKRHDWADPNYRDFMVDLTEKLSSRFSNVMSEGGLSLNAGSNTFDQLLSVTGSAMKPRALPSVNRDESPYSSLLSDDLSEVDHKILDVLDSILFEGVMKKVISERDGSSSGFPFFENTRSAKWPMMMRAQRDQTEIVRLSVGGHFDELLRKHGIVHMCYGGSRAQSESKAKKRAILHPLKLMEPSMSDAEAQGSLPYPEFADKSFPPDERLIAKRIRLIFGPCAAANFICKMYVFPYMHYFKEKYAFANSVKGKSDLEAKLNGFRALFPRALDADIAHRQAYLDDVAGTQPGFKTMIGDPVQFDNFAASRNVNNRFYARLSACTSDDLAHFVRQVSNSAIFVPLTDASVDDGIGPLVVGNPFDPDSNMKRFTLLQSGSSPTSFYSHYLMWLVALRAMYAMGMKDVLNVDFVRKFMSGDAEVYRRTGLFVLVGGDALLVHGLFDVVERFEEFALTTDKEGTHLILLDKSDNSEFFGFVLTLGDAGRVHAYYNLRSFAERTFSPEHSAYDRRRSDIAAGVSARLKLYADHPRFPELLTVLDELHVQHFGVTWTGYASSVIQYTNDADLIYLGNPESIHYMIDIEDVSPELIDADFSHYDPASLNYAYPLVGVEAAPGSFKDTYKEKINEYVTRASGQE